VITDCGTRAPLFFSLLDSFGMTRINPLFHLCDVQVHRSAFRTDISFAFVSFAPPSRPFRLGIQIPKSRIGQNAVAFFGALPQDLGLPPVRMLIAQT
jgi:hypothetical protein